MKFILLILALNVALNATHHNYMPNSTGPTFEQPKRNLL